MNTVLNNTTTLGRLFEMVEGDLFNEFVKSPKSISITFADNEPYKLQSELCIFEDGEDDDTYNNIQDVECEIYAILDSVYSVSELATLVYSISIVDGEIRVAFNILNTNTILGGIEMNNVSNTANNNNEGVVSMNNNTTTRGIHTGAKAIIDGAYTRNTLKETFTFRGRSAEDSMYHVSEEAKKLMDNDVYLTAKDIEDMRHIYAGADRVEILDVYVEESKHGLFATTKVIKLANNPLFDVFGTTNKAVKTGNESKVYGKFLDKFVQITIKEKNNKKDFLEEASRKQFKFFIDETLGLVFMVDGRRFKELTTGTSYDKLTADAKEFKMLLFSAGDARVGRALYYNPTTDFNSSRAIYEKVAPGLYDELKAQLTIEKGAKFASRLGLLKTTGKMDCYLENFIVMYDDVLDMVSGMSDGYALEAAGFTVGKDNITTEAEACKVAKQLRLGLSQKFTNVVIQQSLFARKVKMIMDYLKTLKSSVLENTTRYYNEKGRIVAVIVGDLNKASHIFDSNSTKAMVNYTKKINRGLTVMAINHLSEGHLNSQMNESLFVAAAEQDAADAIAAENAGMNFVPGKHMMRLEGFFNNLLDELMAEGVATILAKDSKDISLSDNYDLSRLASVCPTNPTVINSNYSSFMDTLKNAIQGLSFKTKFANGISSTYNMLLSCDIAAVFGVKVIPNDCVFNAGVARMMIKHPELAEQLAEGVITKSPKMGVYEYLRTRFLSFDELFAIIDAQNIDEDLKNQLKFKYLNAPEGQVFFPSNEEIFKTLAGSDADGDKVQVTFDSYIKSLCTKRVVLIIDTTKDKGEYVEQQSKIGSNFARLIQDKLNKTSKSLEELHLDINGNLTGDVVSTGDGFVESMYMMNMTSQLSIGQITFWNNKLIAILIETLRGNVEYVKAFLKENGIVEGANDELLVVDDSIVNERFALNLKDAMGQVVWTKENLIRFCVYCNEIFRLYQEGAIDATKTGIYLDIIFKCDTVSIERLYNLETVIDKEKKVVIEPAVKDELGNIIKPEKSFTLNFKKIQRNYENKYDSVYINNVKVDVIHFVDAMGAVENRLIDRVNNEFRLVIEENLNIFRYSDSNVQDFIDTMNEVNDNYPKVLQGLYAIKIAYNSLVSERASKDEITSEEREAYNNELSNISNAVRTLIDTINFGHYSDEERELFIAELLLGVGCSWSPNRVNPFSSSKFAYTICPEYAYAYFTGGTTYSASAKVLNRGQHADGSTVMLSRGVSEYGMITDSRYTGEVVYTDGKVVANGSFKEGTDIDRNRAMIIYKETAAATVTRNSSIVVGDDGNIYFYQDVTTDAKPIVAGQMPNTRVFTGEVETDYYVDDLFYVTINTRVGRQFVDVQYAVAYLSL